MVSQLLENAKKDEEESVAKAQSGSSWFRGPSKKQIEAKTNERKRWEAEQFILDGRIRKLQPITEMESALSGIVPGVGLFV